MTVLEFHAEHGIGQQLDDLPTHLEKFFLGQMLPHCAGWKRRGAL